MMDPPCYVTLEARGTWETRNLHQPQRRSRLVARSLTRPLKYCATRPRRFSLTCSPSLGQSSVRGFILHVLAGTYIDKAIMVELLTSKPPYYWAISTSALLTFIFTNTRPSVEYYDSISDRSPLWAWFSLCLDSEPSRRPDVISMQTAVSVTFQTPPLTYNHSN